MLTTTHTTEDEFSEEAHKLESKIMKIFRKHEADPIAASAATLMAMVTIVSLIEEHISLDDAKTTATIAQKTLAELCKKLDESSPATLH